MLHAVTLTYVSPTKEIVSHIEEHKKWLIRGINNGIILFAGPLSDGSGGYILFYSDSMEIVEDFLKEDPFVEYNLVDVSLISTEPAMSTKDFPEKWTAKAKII